MRENNIKPAEAAEILGVSPQFIRVAMQMGQLPIGIAIKLPGSSEYTYQIRRKKAIQNHDIRLPKIYKAYGEN